VIEAYCRQLTEAMAEQVPPWQDALAALTRQRLLEQPHGDMPRWLAAVESLPSMPVTLQADQDRVALVPDSPLQPDALQQVVGQLRQLMPWRKGPFDVLGVDVDTEWRSDWKWRRIQPHISDLSDRRVLDVGCGSGYHCWRMAGAGARLVLGIDPTLLYFFQYLLLHRYAPERAVWFAPVRMEEMPAGAAVFDTVFSMGVLYHRRSPLDHLAELFAALRPGGELILETLVVEGDDTKMLIPEDRYAAMRNVFFLPSVPMLARWLRRSGFVDVRVIDVSETSTDEQHATDWMTFQSLADFLHPDDPTLTLEGYPRPRRAALVATRPLR
jgi:tRNA (mo5U34)-methyltransferase